MKKMIPTQAYSENAHLTASLGNIARAREFYHVPKWSEGYFDINDQGHVCIHPWQNAAHFDLYTMVKNLKKQGLHPPFLLRFPDIIQSRVKEIQQAFSHAIQENAYPGQYTLAYPVKVNHHQHVLSALSEYQSIENTSLAFEVGTKGELLLALGQAPHQSMLICNGFKDLSTVELAAVASELGHQVLIVIEKPYEVALIHEVLQKYPHWQPRLGIRLKLTSTLHTYWEKSAGIEAKFGIDASAWIDLIQALSHYDLLAHIQLLHAHLGSQLVTLNGIHQALKECGLYYQSLIEHGATPKWLDVGGGLAIQYDGSEQPSSFSRHYSIQDYAYQIITTLKDIFEELHLPALDLISESGRAITAHHAVVISDAFPANEKKIKPLTLNAGELPENWQAVLKKMHLSVKNLIDSRQVARDFQALNQCQQNAHMALLQRTLSLKDKAIIDKQIAKLTRALLQKAEWLGVELTEAMAKSSIDALCHMNLSFFQSIPDTWGIQQIMPILPLNRLDKPLAKKVQLVDLTCDSDGCIKTYSQDQHRSHFLTLPHNKPHHGHCLGFFLVGAYQEVLSNHHNLLGQISVVECRFERGQVKFETTKAQSSAHLLSTQGYQLDDLLLHIKKKTLSNSTQMDRAQTLMSQLTDAFQKHSYLEI